MSRKLNSRSTGMTMAAGKQPFSCRSGFTLLEVMVALAIMAIAITALFGSQSRSLSLAIEGKFYGSAALLAQEKLAEYISGVTELIDGEGDFGEGFPGFTWKTEIRDADIDALPQATGRQTGLKRVDLTVAWEEERFTATITEYIRSETR